MDLDTKNSLNVTILWGAIYIVALFGLSFLMEWLISVPYAPPGEDPPWYFIRIHFAKGLASLIGLIVVAGVSFFTWKISIAGTWTNVWLSTLFMGQNVAESVVIYLKCQNIFDPVHAISGWGTFEEFLNDRSLGYAHWFAMGLSVILMVLGRILGFYNKQNLVDLKQRSNS